MLNITAGKLANLLLEPGAPSDGAPPASHYRFGEDNPVNYKYAHKIPFIVKQKQPTNNGGYKAIGFGKTHRNVYKKLTSDNLIDLARSTRPPSRGKAGTC